MEEVEVPMEKIQENIHHEAEHSDRKWFSVSALLSAVLAVLAAIGALTSGHQVNESMLEQIQASDQWSFYQAKSIKAAVLESKRDLLVAFDKPVPENVLKKIEDYRSEQQEVQLKAKEKEASSVEHLRTHEKLAKSVTFFQVAIAITAISVLVRRKSMLILSGLFSLAGAYFLLIGLL